MKYLVAWLILIPNFAFAAETKREFAAFAGVGLSLGQATLSPGGGDGAANFRNHGYLLEGGLTVPVAGRWGVQLGGEVGQTNATNTLASESYMETGAMKFYAAKGGLFFGPVTVGGGYRNTNVRIKSLSQVEGPQDSEYSGWSTFAYGNISLDINKRYRGVVEAQYMNGDLGAGPEGSNTVKFSEVSISLRAFVLFD